MPAIIKSASGTPAATESPAPGSSATAEPTEDTELGTLEEELLAVYGADSKATEGANDHTPATDEEEDSPEAGEDAEQDDPENETEDDEQSPEETEDEEEIEGLESVNPKLRKRFKTLLARERESKQEIATLQALVDDLQADPVPLQPTKGHALTDVRNVNELDERIALARHWKQWCRKNPEGGPVQENGKEVELDAAETQSRLDWAEDVLEAAPDRKAWLQQYQGSHNYAKATYPDLFKKGSVDYNVSAQLLKQLPELVRLPDYEAFVGHYITGLKIRVDESKGIKWMRVAGKEKPKPVIDPKTGKATPAPAVKPKIQPMPAPGRTAPKLVRTTGGSTTEAELQALEDRASEGDEEASRQLLRLLAG